MVHPARVHVGQRSRVDLAVRNRRGRRTPVLRLRDPVSGTRGADLLVPPLGPSERSVRGLPAAHGSAGHRRRRPARGGRVRSVRPRRPRHRRRPGGAPDGAPPHRRGRRRSPTRAPTTRRPASARPTRCGRTGEEFYALRPYVVGDDLRRVHWPSSARLDELHGAAERAAVAGPHHGAARRARGRPPRGTPSRWPCRRRRASWPPPPGARTSSASSPPRAPTPTSPRAPTTCTPSSSTSRWSGSTPTPTCTARSTCSRGARAAARSSWCVAEVPAEDARALHLLRARFGSVTIVQVDRSAWDGRAAGRTPARRRRAPHVRHPVPDRLGGARPPPRRPTAAPAWGHGDERTRR